MKKKPFFITLFEHLENEKCFLNEIKSNFYNFLRAAVWGKIKKQQPQAIRGFQKRFR